MKIFLLVMAILTCMGIQLYWNIIICPKIFDEIWSMK